MRWTTKPTRRDIIKGLVATLAGLTAGGASYGYFLERYRVGVTRQAIPVPGLPDALRGLRIGLLTDPHVSPSVPNVIVGTAVELLQAEKPDLIVLGGDFISWHELGQVDRAAELMKPLTAPHGVFAVLGNHDDEHQMPRALEQRGIAVMRDSVESVTVRGERISFVGLRYWTRREALIAPLTKGLTGLRILLAHDPRRVTAARNLGVPLVLSGHTHGGQIVLPGLGAVAARRYPIDAGLLAGRTTALFVSRGVGTVYLPWRINCPPEVAVLNLERAAT